MEIKLENITYKNIFYKINSSFENNKITAIVGKNNCGKTSLLNLLYDYDVKFDGNIIFDNLLFNSNIKKTSIMDLRKKISYVRQNYESDLFSVNILEDMKVGLSEFDDIKLLDLLKQFDLNDDIFKRNYQDLSSGEKKKILLIKSFIKESDVIILDEPTLGLDNKSIDSLIKVLKREKHNGKTIILTSKRSDFLLAVADKILILNDKNIYEIKNKYDFFSNKSLLSAIGMQMPEIIRFKVKSANNMKSNYRDNINDLIKDIYRSKNEK